MSQIDNNFKNFKNQTLKNLESAMNENKVDSLVIPILNHINSIDEFVTTSSCAGRIILIELPMVGDKKNAIFHGRWHRTIELDEMVQSIEKYSNGQLWLIVQSPIFHIAVQSLISADKLVKIGISCGFKHSGFKTVKDWIIVELVSTERMDVPIGIDGTIIISDDYLSTLNKIGNDLLIRGHKKLERLKDKIKNFK